MYVIMKQVVKNHNSNTDTQQVLFSHLKSKVMQLQPQRNAISQMPMLLAKCFDRMNHNEIESNPIFVLLGFSATNHRFCVYFLSDFRLIALDFNKIWTKGRIEKESEKEISVSALPWWFNQNVHFDIIGFEMSSIAILRSLASFSNDVTFPIRL